MRNKRRVLRGGALAGLAIVGLVAGVACQINVGDGGDGGGNDGGMPDTIDADRTFETFTLAEGETTTVQNDAVVTITGNTTIDGTVEAEDGLLVFRIGGDGVINGTLRAVHDGSPDMDDEGALSDQPVGIYIIIDEGELEIGEDAVLETNGNIVVTDDDTILAQAPGELFDEVENPAADDLATLVPLPPDNEVFDAASVFGGSAAFQAAQALPPITIRGVWPPGGAPPPAGDRPVVIFRFNGQRDLNLDNWTVNGPPAPSGPDEDGDDDPDNVPTRRNGKNGMRLNIRNNGGAINIRNAVVFNLTDGGDGGSMTTQCGNPATGGDGGESGNMRMTAAGGIDLTAGTLTINPGRGGHGGAATVNGGPAGAVGCPGEDGGDAIATGGNGADNRKRLFVRGNVSGLENLIIGPLNGGEGGSATATACDGGDGDPCCDGGAGGTATAIGGSGGDASVSVGALPVDTGDATGGDGGNATATGGEGGDGGDCKFDDGGAGGAGGEANATGGDGGNAANDGSGGSIGGDSGDAEATGGNGGNGGDSGFGTPGVGGDGGAADATPGTPGNGATVGVTGEEAAVEGDDGENGGILPVTLYCISFAFISDPVGVIDPGPREAPVFADDGVTQVGTVMIDLVDIVGATYQWSDDPLAHIGISGGQLEIDVGSLQLEGESGVIGGLRIEPLQGELLPDNPLTVDALDGEGEVIGTESFASLPDNTPNPTMAESVDATFTVSESVAVFRVTVPEGAFVTIIQVYLLDP